MKQTDIWLAVFYLILTKAAAEASGTCSSLPSLAPLRERLEALGIDDALQCIRSVPAFLSATPERRDITKILGDSRCVLPSFDKIARTGTEALFCLQSTCRLSKAQSAAAENSTGFEYDTAMAAPHPCTILSANAVENSSSELDALLARLNSTRDACCPSEGGGSSSDCLSALQATEKSFRKLFASLKQSPRPLSVSRMYSKPPRPVDGNSVQSLQDCFRGLEELSDFFTSTLTAEEKNQNETETQLHYLFGTLRESTDRLINLVNELSRSNNILHGSYGMAEASGLLVCASVFPCRNNSLLPPCHETCSFVKTLLHSLKPFAYIDRIPILRMLRLATNWVCTGQKNTERGACIESSCRSADCSKHASSTRLASVQSPGRTDNPPAGLCLRFRCPYPLRATPHSAHWDRSISSNLRSLHAALEQAFPNASRPFDERLLPCGQDCVSAGFTEKEEKLTRLLLSLGALGVELFAVVAALAFFFNRATLGSVLVRRLVLYFNLTAALTVSVFVPVAFSDVTSVVCHADGTRRLDEPNTNARCVLTETLAHFGINMNGVLFVSFTHAWYEMIRSLHNPGATARSRKASGHSLTGRGRENVYFMDAVYLGGSVLVSLMIVLPVLIRRGIEGSPLYGICLAKIDGFFLEAVIAPLAVFCAIGIIFLSVGLYKLAKHRRAERQRRMRLDSDAEGVLPSSSFSPSRRKRLAGAGGTKNSAFNRLISQLFLYIIVLLVNIIGLIILGVYVGVNRDDWKEKTKAHLTCVLSSCQPEMCPPLPRIQVGFFLTPFLVGFVSYMILCSWACSWPLWQHLRLCKSLLQFFSARREARQAQEADGERRKSAGSENSSSSGSGSGESASTNATLKTNASAVTSSV